MVHIIGLFIYLYMAEGQPYGFSHETNEEVT